MYGHGIFTSGFAVVKPLLNLKIQENIGIPLPASFI
jgi:hypothetical protein